VICIVVLIATLVALCAGDKVTSLGVVVSGTIKEQEYGIGLSSNGDVAVRVLPLNALQVSA